MKKTLFCFIAFFFFQCTIAQEIKFLVFADLHYDYVPDGKNEYVSFWKLPAKIRYK